MADAFHRLTERTIQHISKDPFVGAWRAVAIITTSVTIVGGLLVRLTDPDNFHSVWAGFWWSIQTVTTVGYGDIVPTSVGGRIIGSLVMIGGIGFITVTTAAIASAFVEAARERRVADDDGDVESDIALLRTEIATLTQEVRDLRAAVLTGASEPDPPAR
jgi:voltage-gated potassium channel